MSVTTALLLTATWIGIELLAREIGRHGHDPFAWGCSGCCRAAGHLCGGRHRPALMLDLLAPQHGRLGPGSAAGRPSGRGVAATDLTTPGARAGQAAARARSSMS